VNRQRSERILPLLLVMELALVGLFGYGFYRWTFEWRLNGPVVSGEVIDLREHNGTRYVTYRFEAGGSWHEHERRITPELHDTLHLGDEVDVIYSPIDPGASGIPGQGGSDFDLPHLPGTFFNLAFLAYYLPAAILLNGGVVLGLWWKVRRRAREAGLAPTTT
jgi:hypothetical protein